MSTLFVCALILSGVGLADAGQRGIRTAEVELTHALAKRVAAGHHDTCKAMAGVGIDYPVLVQRALDGEPRAIRLMLSLAQTVKFEGAVGLSYASTRYKVAILVGDDKLLAAYKGYAPIARSTEIRKSFLGWPNPAASDQGEAEAEIQKRLPKFWKFLTMQANQIAGD